ncbi:MAG: acyltransferase [Pyrinomonadaceae bacterium]
MKACDGHEEQMSASTGRLVNIDALRGVAAFAVVLFHLTGGMKAFVAGPTALNFFPAFGYAGVFLFFVISGFCIHLRWAKRKAAGDIDPAIDFIPFWKRRWVRLYPAYIATLVLFIVWRYYTGELETGGFFIYDVVSHFSMLHNLDGRTVYSFNGVLWTLAIEEQLYLLYFVLLALRKRLGWTTTLIVCFSMRFVWFGICYAIRPFHDLPFSEGALSNWWIWALGALAVEAYFGLIKLPRWTAAPVLGAISLTIAGVLNYGMFAFNNNLWARAAVLTEPLFWGFGFFAFVNRVMMYEGKFDSVVIRAAAFIGLFSYSVYLTHEFVLESLKVMPGVFLAAACLVFAYLFYLLFERPFLAKKTDHVVPANEVAT